MIEDLELEVEFRAASTGEERFPYVGKYIGEFINLKPEGKGIMYYDIGGKYDGEWKDGKRHGKGIMYYASGDKYEGRWKNDKREGFGIYYYGENGPTYAGDWKNDKLMEHKFFPSDDENKKLLDELNNFIINNKKNFNSILNKYKLD